jgi:hypothetical protein
MPLVEAESITFVERDGVVWAAHMWCYMRDRMRPARVDILLALYRPEWLDRPDPPFTRPPAS